MASILSRPQCLKGIRKALALCDEKPQVTSGSLQIANNAESISLPWALYQICKIACCACAGNAGNVFPATVGWRSRHASRHVRDARAVMHVGIANLRFPLKSVAGKTFPAIPAHAQPAILRIWQEAHVVIRVKSDPNHGTYDYIIFPIETRTF